MLACQEKKTDSPTEKAEVKTTEKAETAEKKPTPNPDYAKLIQGYWTMPKDEDGTQPWAMYDADKVYSNGSEQGIEYQIEGDKLFMRVLGGGKPAEYKITALDEKKLTLQMDETGEETWTRTDKKKAKEPKITSIDAKLLVGKWVNEQAEDEFSKQRAYKANGKVDMTPFNDLASYKVVGDKIKYTNVVNGGQPYEDVITSLTAQELVINGKFKFKRTK
jgi:hypothetical protein